MTEPLLPGVQESISPVTGAGCNTDAAGCLRDDVVSGWAVSLNAPSGYSIELFGEPEASLQKGGSITATYCLT